MRTKTNNEDLKRQCQLTGQWRLNAVAYLLGISKAKVERLIRNGEILSTRDHDSRGNIKNTGQHIRAEHLRDYLQRMYGKQAPILKEINP